MPSKHVGDHRFISKLIVLNSRETVCLPWLRIFFAFFIVREATEPFTLKQTMRPRKIMRPVRKGFLILMDSINIINIIIECCYNLKFHVYQVL